jgi:hypothetical protein
MDAYGNGQQHHGASAPDIRTMLAASFADEQEPTTAMLARAMIYAQDAARKLAGAKSFKAEAERFRSEVQKNTFEQTETLCRQMHEEAEEDMVAARETKEEAESVWETARAELDRATILRQDAEQIMATARADAEEYRRTLIAESEREAFSIKDTARNQVNAELAERQVTADDEIRKGITAIEKMQAAVQAELEPSRCTRKLSTSAQLRPPGRSPYPKLHPGRPSAARSASPARADRRPRRIPKAHG